jgi:hypothetical protein
LKTDTRIAQVYGKANESQRASVGAR